MIHVYLWLDKMEESALTSKETTLCLNRANNPGPLNPQMYGSILVFK